MEAIMYKSLDFWKYTKEMHVARWKIIKEMFSALSNRMSFLHSILHTDNKLIHQKGMAFTRIRL